MWLKAEYKEHGCEHEGFRPRTIRVTLVDSLVAPVFTSDKSIRLSKVFPLIKNIHFKLKETTEIRFFEFDVPFRVLGKIKQKASKELQESIFFSYGSCSVLLFTDSKRLIKEFCDLDLGAIHAEETWQIEDSFIVNLTTSVNRSNSDSLAAVSDYGVLPPIERCILDEFSIAIKIFENKIGDHEHYDISALNRLVQIVNNYIEELIYFHKPEGPIPTSSYLTTATEIESPLEKQIQIQQIVDRLIQINTSLSYVSTQSYSGSVPILERRSLIRRSSLLGIGVAIRALNRIVNHIEEAFYTKNYFEIISNLMGTASSLEGLEPAGHSRATWYQSNIDHLKCTEESERYPRKLAYFSSRYGFRESEYTITASLNSVSNGLSLEWSLLTITHEMLHSHARLILNSIFFSEEGSGDENYRGFYQQYSNKILGKAVSSYKLIDSIREIIFTYCLRTREYGSLTQKREYRTYNSKNSSVDFLCPEFLKFHEFFKSEYKNLNEIFVHVLDLHYFYGGRTTKYVPLIWCSWSGVPHVNANIREYVLRTLLAIASKIDTDPFDRWETAIEEFKTIINELPERIKQIPLINSLVAVLENRTELDKYYFGAFKNSLMVVDMVMDIFLSKDIRKLFWSDENLNVESPETSSEVEFSYNVSDDFVDVPIACPIPYLFDRMIHALENDVDPEYLERNTAIGMLGVNSR